MFRGHGKSSWRGEGHCKSLAWLGVMANNRGVVRGYGKSSWHGDCHGIVKAWKTYTARFKVVEKSNGKEIYSSISRL